MKELSGTEKLEAVKLIMETLGYEFEGMTVSEAFSLFHILRDEIDTFMEEK